MTIYNKLKELRHDLRMDQTQFADFIGVNKNLYNKWENQKGQPSLEWCFKIQLKTGKQIQDFIIYKPDEN
ncbi:helix-turn-helix transcriptional regulator [Paenibacillus naphthalenovorans]|uniref:Xre family transcriptional regulator n=1 Tax=Paenibacillus naphthalenovorans TaxID=162209 RepID=A0A0U2UGD6_9BACL|nr:helix-turn-helix domain-containing protein [Paenibacillus naphthalenovorans]ALS22252.1 Xre family transcriptional regulator [Paenibacillus naphthalenovorans]